jgi:uncharacterized membrane protein YfcA
VVEVEQLPHIQPQMAVAAALAVVVISAEVAGLARRTKDMLVEIRPAMLAALAAVALVGLGVLEVVLQLAEPAALEYLVLLLEVP